VTCVREAAIRDQGRSMCFGLGMATAPMMPALRNAFQRSAEDE